MRRRDELKLRRMVSNYRNGIEESHVATTQQIDAWVSRYETAMRAWLSKQERGKR